MGKRLFPALLLTLTTALLFAPTTAHADGTTDARLAQALFDEARTLMDQKRFAEACPKLVESQRLDPAGGTLLNLAVCHAGEGKIASALVEYHEALASATRDGRKDREAIARSSIASLERDVPRLTIAVPRPVEGMEIKLDSTVVPRAAWGLATPVDPGTHVVSVTHPGQTPMSVYVNIAVGERKSFEVPASGGAPVVAAQAQAQAHPQQPTIMVVREKHANPVFWTAVSLTIAGAVTAGVTAVMAAGENSTASDGCIEDRVWCKDQPSRDALSSARTLAWVSTGALVVAGIAGLVAIIVPSKREVTSSTTTTGRALTPMLTPRGIVF